MCLNIIVNLSKYTSALIACITLSSVFAERLDEHRHGLARYQGSEASKESIFQVSTM